MELLIMAAGMGSRFGGLKQIEPLGPNNEFIIDYSIYDAKLAGFDKVIFIIKEENYELFKETIGKRVEKHIKVDYVFQKMDTIPSFVEIPKDRIKPWGTAHAIYEAREKITGPFLVINADDYYGREAFMVARDFLKSEGDNKYATIAYKAGNTMTENGSVKRGVINSTNGVLKSIVECNLKYDDKRIIATPIDSDKSFEVDKNSLVSMNMLTFDLSIFPFLERMMNKFFIDNKDNLEKSEFLIPTQLENAIEEGRIVRVLETNSNWYGVTYKEDADSVREALKKLTEDGIYKKNLWEE